VKNWKKHLIGEVKLPISNGSVVIDENQLQRPLEWPKAVCRCVCKQCGQVAEIDLIYARGLLKTMAILKSLPDILLEKQEHFQNYYFEISYCEYCERTEVSIELKEIKRE
jgi:hypothetical protein